MYPYGVLVDVALLPPSFVVFVYVETPFFDCTVLVRVTVFPLPCCAFVPLALGVDDVCGAGTTGVALFDMALFDIASLALFDMLSVAFSVALLLVLLLMSPEVALSLAALSVLLPKLLSVPLAEFVLLSAEFSAELSVELLMALSVELEVSVLSPLAAALSVLLLALLLASSLLPDELRFATEVVVLLLVSSVGASLPCVKYQMAAPTSAKASTPAIHLDVLVLSPANRVTVVSCSKPIIAADLLRSTPKLPCERRQNLCKRSAAHACSRYFSDVITNRVLDLS